MSGLLNDGVSTAKLWETGEPSAASERGGQGGQVNSQASARARESGRGQTEVVTELSRVMPNMEAIGRI